MGLRGPKPTPTAILEKQGSWRAKARNKSGEPMLPKGLPECPPYITGLAKQAWDEITPILQTMGVMTTADATALAMLCDVYAQWRNASAQVEAQGQVVKLPNGYPGPNPYLSIKTKSQIALQKLLCEFGLTPASRARVSTAKPTAEPGQTILGFIGNEAA